MKKSATATSIEPWLTVAKGESAVMFYKSAFGAEETYRLADPAGGLVIRLSVGQAGFWISSDNHAVNLILGGDNVRMILIVDDPVGIFATAIKAGATPVFPVTDSHGWRIGRLVDPFGLHWEVGHKLEP